MGVKDVYDNYLKDGKLSFSIKNARVLPFNTRSNRVTYNNGFRGIVGEVFRISEGFSLSDVKLGEKAREMISKGDIEVDDEHLEKFIEVVEEFNPQNLYHKTKNINLFKFNPLGASKVMLQMDELKQKQIEQNRKESDIGEFIYQRFISNHIEFSEFINCSHETDVLTKLYDNIFSNSDDSNQSGIEYLEYSNQFLDVVYEDLKYMLTDETFFIEHIEDFLAFYYFSYIVQLAIAIDAKHTVGSEIYPLYWMNDSEKAGHNREAVKRGWKHFHENIAKRLWVNNIVIDIMALISNCSVISYNEFYDCDYGHEVIEVIVRFNEIINGHVNVDAITDSRSAVLVLKKLLEKYYDSEKTRQGTQSRYTLWIDDFGKKFFLKFRSKYGYTLNLTEDILGMQVALIVKEERLKLNVFFIELEKRGIFLDNRSKKEVINILDKQGLLEKKSDSGDAQYVRKVLR